MGLEEFNSDGLYRVCEGTAPRRDTTMPLYTVFLGSTGLPEVLEAKAKSCYKEIYSESVISPAQSTSLKTLKPPENTWIAARGLQFRTCST